MKQNTCRAIGRKRIVISRPVAQFVDRIDVIEKNPPQVLERPVERDRPVSTPPFGRARDAQRVQYRVERNRGRGRTARACTGITLCGRAGGAVDPLGRLRHEHVGVHGVVLPASAGKLEQSRGAATGHA